MDHELRWDPLPNLKEPTGDKNESKENGNGDATDDESSSTSSSDDEAVLDNPVSMTPYRYAPLSSISEVTLHRMDLGDCQLTNEEFV